MSLSSVDWLVTLSISADGSRRAADFSSLLSGKVLILVVGVQVEDAVRTEILF